MNKSSSDTDQDQQQLIVVKQMDADIKLLMEELELETIEEAEREMKQHIEKMHKYNEVKDIGQALLGKLAMAQGKTVKQLYPEFGLDETD